MAFVDVRKPSSSVAQPPSFPPPPFSQPPQNSEVQTSTGTYARVPVAVPAVENQQRLTNLFAEAEQARAERTEARIFGVIIYFVSLTNLVLLGKWIR